MSDTFTITVRESYIPVVHPPDGVVYNLAPDLSTTYTIQIPADDDQET